MIRVSIIILLATAVFCSAAIDEDDEPCRGVNEIKYPCGKRCEETCNATPGPFCDAIQCLPPFGCRCKSGFARNLETDECVRKQDCPVNRCGNGEFLGVCGKTCEGTCSKPSRSVACLRHNCSGLGCQCDLIADYVRNEKTGKCVKIEDC